MIFTQMFNYLLNEKDITPYRMSKDTGIPDRMIGYWKKGERIPSAESLIKIADYFNVSVDYLLGRNQDTDN
ncbi:MAG: helix-turn-helix domain-containing protein [Oscillospiraceae bacterium]|nr:helix-turn-helix domain-containing protein [Oscillospiraceae bacterium]